jgi:hypothetical protein
MALLPLSNCASTRVHDFQWCVDLGPDGAACNHYLTSAPVQIPKAEWDKVRVGDFCMSAQAFGARKEEQEKLCSSSPCTYVSGKAAK